MTTLNWTDNALRDPRLSEHKPWREAISPEAMQRARHDIAAWPGYAPTPLRRLDRLAAELGLGAIAYKDEGGRFGLGSFKALGGAYAVQRLVAEADGRPLTVICATDGNHGRAVAWGARQFGASAVILIHAQVSEGRKQAIEAFGARVVRVDGNYDESVREAQRLADEHGWVVVSDTSYEGYEDIPGMVMQGYTVMAHEAVEQCAGLGGPPSHVFLQCGVGGFAAAVIAQTGELLAPDLPAFVAVEPEAAACVVASLREQRPSAVEGELETLMAGLSCGEISAVAWRILAPALTGAMTVPEAMVPEAMRGLADGLWSDEPVIAGESAVAGLCGLIAAARDEGLRDRLGLGADSRVLLFGTEGATDAALYADIVGRSADEVAGRS